MTTPPPPKPPTPSSCGSEQPATTSRRRTPQLFPIFAFASSRHHLRTGTGPDTGPDPLPTHPKSRVRPSVNHGINVVSPCCGRFSVRPASGRGPFLHIGLAFVRFRPLPNFYAERPLFVLTWQARPERSFPIDPSRSVPRPRGIPPFAFAGRRRGIRSSGRRDEFVIGGDGEGGVRRRDSN